MLNISTNKEQSRKPLSPTKTIISTLLFLGLSYLSINPVFSSPSERVSAQATIPQGNRVDLAVVVSSTITDLTMVPANGAEVSHEYIFIMEHPM